METGGSRPRLPANVKTGKAYWGGNSIWLASVAGKNGYSDHRWGTYKQVKDLGGQVRRREKGCQILYWDWEKRQLARDGSGRPVLDESGKPLYETRPRETPFVYRYTVFNAEQCDGLPARAQDAIPRNWNPVEEAERVLQATGAQIRHSDEDRAYYDLRRDRITLPHREQFPNSPGYYQADQHELGHWTGPADRLNRETLLKGIAEGPYSQQYAQEELRAEISSMMSGDRLALGHDPSRHAAYVGHWIKALKDDPREIYRAAQDAQEISDYVLGRPRERDAEREGEREPQRARDPSRDDRREAGGETAVMPTLPEPGPNEQYRLFQRAGSGPGR
ncbi:MAG: zincin-like metallopeptidase domain-containing protein [Bryobacterales bacterium]|nr:zincin-like metallopeptidase domain-containing protein [Bryobacterales bacterium]